MKRMIALGVLAAATVGCAADGSANETEIQSSEVNEAAWPSQLPVGRGCLSTSPLVEGRYPGKNLRVEFRAAGEAVVEVYDAQTGFFVDDVDFPRVRQNAVGKLSLESSFVLSSFSSGALLTQERIFDGSFVVELKPLDERLTMRIGNATVPMKCDVHPGDAKLMNPKAPKVVPAKPVRAGVTYPWPLAAIKPCDASAPIPSGRFQGDVLRLKFAAAGVYYEVYWQETGYKVEKRVYSTNLLPGGGYEIGKRGESAFNLYGKAVPVEVDGKSYLTFQPAGGASEIGGDVPLSCEFLQ